MLTAGIDLSVAGTATAAGYVMAAQGSEGTPRALAVSLGVGLAIGLFNGIGVGIFQVNPLIMTLGTSIMIVGGLQVYAQRLQTGEQVVPSSINELSTGRIFSYVPTSMLLWVPLAVVIVLGLRYSGFGRMLYAVGDNRRACRIAGVRVWQVLVAVYACCGVLAATAGILLAGANNPDTTLANDYLLPSVAAVVIGGTSIFGGVGGYVGTVLGAIILTLLNNLLTLMETTQEFKLILYGLIVLSLAWMYSALARRR
jgi:ribose transport system permease protein